MVYIGRESSRRRWPPRRKSITLRAGAPRRAICVLELGRLVFQPGAGAPHATDLERGRRPGLGRDFRELVQLTQHFDVFHMMPPLVEPQDIPTTSAPLFHDGSAADADATSCPSSLRAARRR